MSYFCLTMDIPFVYYPALEAATEGSLVSLPPDESFHLGRVLRLRQGAPVTLTDGGGRLAGAVLVTPSSAEAVVRLESLLLHARRKYSIHIAIAPPRHPDRLEWFLEKATETGVDTISLLVCERSGKWKVKPDRLHRLLVAAMKQSRQVWLPALTGPVSFPEWLAQVAEKGRWIGYCTGEQPLLATQAGEYPDNVVAIGPEGDFTPEEAGLARKNGFIPISLGPNRLRTETAGLLACHTLHVVRFVKM